MGRGASGTGALYLVGAVIALIIFIIIEIAEFVKENIWLSLLVFFIIIVIIISPKIIDFLEEKRKRKERDEKEEHLNLIRIKNEEDRRLTNELISKQIPHVLYVVSSHGSRKHIALQQIGIEGSVKKINSIPLNYYYNGDKTIYLGFERTTNKNLIIFSAPKSQLLLNTGINIEFLFLNGETLNYTFDMKAETNNNYNSSKINTNSCEVFLEQLMLFVNESIEKVIIENSLGQIISVVTFPTVHRTWTKSHEIIKNMAYQFLRIVYEEFGDNAIRKIQIFDKKSTFHRSSIPQNVQNRVWRRDGGVCVKCSSNINLEFDHIIPVSKGGANTYRNLQLLCEKCNRSKSNKIG